MEKKGSILMQKYELGRMLGQGTFAKVYYARSVETGQSVAIKVINKEKVMKIGLIDQIKREISVMRLVRHPNVVQLYEVMATKTKIFFAMEYVKGGELFAKVARGRLKEGDARKYFQQLISAVDFCHSRGVYHRDLKPENLLLDENGDLKVSDFGLSALYESRRPDGLLHTTCGTPAYVAPEVISKRGYDGAKADVWACGVVLYVLLAGFLPFNDRNLMEMYKRISKGEFKCPQWFAPEVRKLITKILDPSPRSRIPLPKIMENSWFKKGIKLAIDPNLINQDEIIDNSSSDSTPRDVREAFGSDSSNSSMMRVNSMNAFEIISLSPGFNLSSLFKEDANYAPESRFSSNRSSSTIVSKFEEIAETERFNIRKKDGRVKLQSNKEGRKGLLAIEAEIFEIAPSVHMVELKKAAGDTWEYNKFCDQELKPALKDIVWTWEGGDPKLQHQPSIARTVSN